MTALATIKSAVAAEFGVTVRAMLAADRHRSVQFPRQIATYLCHQVGKASLTRIGLSFRQHHTSVMHSVNRIRTLRKENPVLDEQLVRLAGKLEHCVDMGDEEDEEGREPALVAAPAAKPALAVATPEEIEDIQVLPRDLRHEEMRRAFGFDGSDRPAAGTGCAWCRERGHFCPAKGWCGDDPLCAACGEGLACSQDEAVAKLHGSPAEFEMEDGYAPPVCRTIALTAEQRRPVQEPVTARDWTIKASLSVENLRKVKPVAVKKAPVAKPARVRAIRRVVQPKPMGRPVTAVPLLCACGKRLDPRRAKKSGQCRPCKSLARQAVDVTLNTRTTKERAMPKFEIKQAVAISAVPVFAPVGRVSVYEPAYEALTKLGGGEALPLSFESVKEALGGMAAMRKIAERNKQKLKSSRSSDRLTVFFWLGDKEASA